MKTNQFTFVYSSVQLAYCLQQQDKNVEALTLYNDVLKSKYNLFNLYSYIHLFYLIDQQI
jgi:hypothetical protein